MNEIPVNIFNVLVAINILLIVISLFIKEDAGAVVTSFISVFLSYMLSQMIINGNVLMYHDTGTYTVVRNVGISYFLMFLGMTMFVVMILKIISFLKQPADTIFDEGDEEYGY